MDKNFVFFIVDSARSYSLGGIDDRDKLDMMFDFENESISFENTITSAPSSIMSFLAMATSMPSYYIARNYDDFRYDQNQMLTLPKLFINNGYESKSILNARECRVKFDSMIEHVGKKHYPKGLSENHYIENLGHSWPNYNLNEILESFLQNRKSKKPLFLLVWYQIRLDPNCSQEVLKGIDILKKYEYWDDSIFLLSADHGYPDPKREMTEEKRIQMGFSSVSHDLQLYDDNIKIPFYLKYPNVKPKKIFEQTSTMDILPTVIDLMNLEYQKSDMQKFQGSSLIPLIKRNKNAIDYFERRKLRSDGRFFAQSDRITSIRSNRYKLIIRPDDEIKEFFDLENDPGEDNNLVNNHKYYENIKEYEKIYEKSEDQAIEFQTEYLVKKLRKKIMLKSKSKEPNLLFIAFVEQYYIDIIIGSIFKLFNQKKVDLIASSNYKNDNNKDYIDLLSKVDTKDSINSIDISELMKQKNYDTVLILKEKNNESFLIENLKKLLSKLNFKTSIILNPNMELEHNSKALKYYNIFQAEKKYWIKNPRLLLLRILQFFTNKNILIPK